ncbi:pectinesterase [Setaria viridis]
MAAVSLSPPLLLLAVLLLTTVGTTQCHGHKRHHHHTDRTRRPNKAAAADASPPADTAHHAICHKTPHPVSCLAAVASHPDAVAVASAKAVEASAVSVQLLPPNLLSVVLASLRGAASALSSLSPAISTLSAPAGGASLRRGAAQDCQELHAGSLSSLSRSASLLAAPGNGEGLPAVRAHLAAALANKATCLDGLAGASSGPGVAGLLASLDGAYEHVSNSLALVARGAGGGLSAAGFANAVAKVIHHRHLLQDDDDYDDNGDSGDGDSSSNGDGDGGNADQPAVTVITVAKDGTGNFRTVGEAVAAAPNNSRTRTVIRVKAGTYEENVEVPPYKTNIALVGDGRGATVITGSRSAGGGWTTFRTATFGVSGEGFLARDVTFRNTAGAAGGQAVALRVGADLAAFYRCGVEAHQDALYAHSFRQFYRECAVAGTVDAVFGDAAAVLQGCALLARAPLPGQFVVLTAQGRGDPNEDTGIALHNCTVSAAASMPAGTRTFLGRPWGAYARAVVMDSYLGQIVDREGWAEWPGAEPGRGDTVFFGEYGNGGPGADTEGRVGWAGVRQMDYDEAAQFAVENFIYGDEWLGATSFPYDDDV